jgi:hypothetical protein
MLKRKKNERDENDSFVHALKDIVSSHFRF